MTAVSSQQRSGTSGTGTRRFVGAPEAPRRRNYPLAALALGAFTLGTLLFVFFFGGADERDPIVSIRNSVAQGDVIAEADLVQVEVAMSAQGDVVRWADRAVLVGREAVAALPAGAFPHSASVRDAAIIPAGFGELGVLLPRGELPSQRLVAGDRVDIVIDTRGVEPSIGASSVDLLSVSINDENAYLTLLVPDEAAVAVSAAIAQSEFRLVRADQ